MGHAGDRLCSFNDAGTKSTLYSEKDVANILESEMKKIELQCMIVYAILHIEQVDIIIMNYHTSVLNVTMPRHTDHAANTGIWRNSKIW